VPNTVRTLLENKEKRKALSVLDTNKLVIDPICGCFDKSHLLHAGQNCSQVILQGVEVILILRSDSRLEVLQSPVDIPGGQPWSPGSDLDL
jgi:hypothetical protein